ncbi:MAG: DUF2510 domain-containing protein [Actinomycetes bacterium]
MGVPAGWYKSDSDEGNLRYWDGQAWTDEVRPDPAAPADLSATTDAPEPSKPEGLVKRSWRWLMHRRLWVRLVAFGVPAFFWGLTGSVFFFLLTALLAAWCIHGAVRRRSTNGEERSARRRIIVGLLVTVGLFPLLVVTFGPGTSVREQVDPEYGAQRAATRQADAVRASEKALVQASEDAAAAAAQASEEAQAARVQASEEAEAARVQASEEAQAALVQASEEAEAARVQASEEAAAAAQASKEAQSARAQGSEQAAAAPTPKPTATTTAPAAAIPISGEVTLRYPVLTLDAMKEVTKKRGCVGVDDFADVRPGAQIVITGPDGVIVGTGSVTGSRSDILDSECIFSISAEAPPGLQFYGIQVGDQPPQVFKEPELRNLTWRIGADKTQV